MQTSKSTQTTPRPQGQTRPATPAPIPGLTAYQAMAADNRYWAAYYSVTPDDNGDFIARRVAERAMADYIARIRAPYREEV